MDPARVNRTSATLAILATALAVMAGCATEFEQRYAAAEQLRSEASAAGAEWFETGKLLEQAKEAADGGNMDTAYLLLEKARFQAETAIKQAEQESSAWADRVVQ